MKHLFLSLSLIGAASLVACGKTEAPAAPAAEPAAAAAPAEAPAASQWPELRVAIDATYKPFTYKTDSGEPAGFDVDVAKALCEELKSKCVFVEQAWDGMIPGLQAKKYDVIISSMSITEERKQAVDFTGKYYNTPSCVVVKSDLNLGAEAANFKGKKLGVLKASTQEKYAMGELQPAGATIVPTTLKTRSTWTSNRAVWTVRWPTWLKSTAASCRRPMAKATPVLAHRIPVEFDAKYFGAGAGVALRKEDTALRDALDAGIKAIRDNGKWQAIAEKHVPGVDLWGS